MIILPTENLKTFFDNMLDPLMLVEIYPSDATPVFNPAQAEKRFASVNGVSFLGFEYERFVKNLGNVRRTNDNEINSSSFSLDNNEREISDLELGEPNGRSYFEGKVVVFRFISQSLSKTLDDSLVFYAGKIERPDGGSHDSLDLRAFAPFGTKDKKIPRRRFTPNDANGRTRADPLFEGFPNIQRYGQTTYYRTVRPWWGFGFVKKKKRQSLQWSSFSDLDTERYVGIGFGRTQVLGVNLQAADVGNTIEASTAFCEGVIKDYIKIFCTNPRLSRQAVHERFGHLGNQNGQVRIGNNWIGDGIYSRTAWAGTRWGGTNIENVVEALEVVALMLTSIITVPDSNGAYNSTDWSDNGSAIMLHILTNKEFWNVDQDWFNLEKFFDAHLYNDETIFDKSFSDLLFVPSTSLQANIDELPSYRSTSAFTTEYVKFLKGDATHLEAFAQKSIVETYDESENAVPIDPEDFPEDFPNNTPNINLSLFLRRRYTTNIFSNEDMELREFGEIIMRNSRMNISQSTLDGRYQLNHKKPTDFALASSAIPENTSIINLDDVSNFIGNLSGHILVGPHTQNVEARKLTSVNYDLAQNNVTTSSSQGNVTIVGFAGCDGNDTPATARFTFNTTENTTIEIDGEEIAVTTNPLGDTLYTLTGFFFAAINSHPRLRRKFKADWVVGNNYIDITAKFGKITFDQPTENDHLAPIANPVAEPTLTALPNGNLRAGFYKVAYAYENENGRTLISAPEFIELQDDEKIQVDAVPAPDATSSVVWYVNPLGSNYRLRKIGTHTNEQFEIDSLPSLSNELPNDINRTGCELMRVAMIFSDKPNDSRSSEKPQRILRGTYRWILGSQKDAINTVSLDFRDSIRDFALTELRISDDAHIGIVGKENLEEFNGTSIDNSHQATRIALGLLNEFQDAGFLYDWESDGKALLLEENDVVAITDKTAKIVLLPIFINELEFEFEKNNVPKVAFQGHKYTTTLYDDSVVERQIPIIRDLDQDQSNFLDQFQDIKTFETYAEFLAYTLQPNKRYAVKDIGIYDYQGNDAKLGSQAIIDNEIWFLFRKNVIEISENYASLINDYTIRVDLNKTGSNIDLTLTDSYIGHELIIRKVDSSANIINLIGTINGSTTETIVNQWNSIHIQYVGDSKWERIS